ncbi:hypothetical protein D3C80_1596720 [compost metagenome]
MFTPGIAFRQQPDALMQTRQSYRIAQQLQSFALHQFFRPQLQRLSHPFFTVTLNRPAQVVTRRRQRRCQCVE